MLSDTPARTLTDEELASRAQDGCCWSFEELVRRYQVPLLHFLERWTGREEAEDLLQDTFVRAYRNLDLYEPRYRFAPWLFTIARRLSINRQRGRQPQTGGETFESVEDMQPSPAEQAAETEYRGRLWELARQVLTESQMTATWLYYVEDMSVKEIGRVLGRSTEAAKATLFRARNRLRPLLEEQKPDGSLGKTEHWPRLRKKDRCA